MEKKKFKQKKKKEIAIRTSIRNRRKMDNSELLYTYMTNIGFKVWNLHELND